VPNWCSNDLYIYGKGRHEIVTAIAGKDHAVIDFDKIIPMPTILSGTVKGSTENMAAVLLGWETGSYMLDWDWVKEAGVTTLEGLKALLLKRDNTLLATAETMKQARAETGYTNWYDWCVENWGTKWNAHDGSCEEHRTRFLLQFDTAWSPPVPVIEALSEKYPKNKFSLRYYEAGMGYKGRFAVKGGQVLENYQGEYRGRRGG